MPFALGPYEFDRPVILAPLSGITDLPYRRLVADFGADMVVSEMIASAGVIYKNRESAERGATWAEEKPRVIQLAGVDPHLMAEAARLCQQLGAEIVDINMGCPVKKVVSGCAGSALMREEDLAARIMDATVNAVDIPVTLKMRTGWDEFDRNAPKLAAIAERAGIAMITVHGRTRCQFFDGRADWHFIRQVKEAVKIPVIANGDVARVEDAEEILGLSKADGVMVGRAVRGRPWFVNQVRAYLRDGVRLPDPTTARQLDILLAHYHEMLDYYGAARGVRIARKHLGWYMDTAALDGPLRREVMKANDPARVSDLLQNLYQQKAAA